MGTYQTEIKEVVLPSGRFARIRSLTGKDYLTAKSAEMVGCDMSFVLACIATTIDDKPLQYDDLLNMDLREIMVIQEVIIAFMKAPITSPKPSTPFQPPQSGASKDT